MFDLVPRCPVSQCLPLKLFFAVKLHNGRSF